MLRLLILLAISSTLSGATTKPNIIFILCDDLGPGDIGVLFQNERAKNNVASEPWHFTPNLDQMAAEGATMPHHYSAAPVCAPARASLLGGVHQGHANVRNNQFDKALEYNHTLASVLKRSGYATFAIGKWGLQGKPSNSEKTDYMAHPMRRGFDEYFGLISHVGGHRHYPKENNKRLIENTRDVTAIYDKCYTTDLFTARAKKWIVDHQTATPDQPFFVYLSYSTPHAQLQTPTGPYPDGGGLRGGLQWTGREGEMINTANGNIDSWIHPDYINARWSGWDSSASNSEPWPNVYQRYATMVRRIDNCVGDLIQLLKDLKIDENTLIVFTSDNGATKESYLKEPLRPDFFNSFGPYDGIKRDLLEGGIRVGALVRWPAGITPNTFVEHPSAFWDWMPTFCDLAGRAAPARSDGRSILPALQGTVESSSPKLYFEYEHPKKTPNYSEFNPEHRNRLRKQMQAVRIGEYVGVRYDIKAHNTPFKIYDVVRDPKQTQDLAAERPDLQKLMKDTSLRMRRTNSSAIRPYDKVPVPSLKIDGLEKGLAWKSYQLDSPWVAQTDTLKPDDSGITSVLSPDGLQKPTGTQLLLSGYLKVPTTGEYTFSIQTKNNTVIRIHDAILLDADAGYNRGAKRSTKIHLEAGLHPIRCYIKLGQSKDWSFQWSSSDIAQQPISADALYYQSY